MSKFWLVGAVTVVIAVGVGAVVFALVTTRGGVELLPADSPEGVVQRYLLALEKEDYKEAYQYLSSEIRGRCSPEGLARNNYWRISDGGSVTLDKTQDFGDRAIVKATVTTFDANAPFGASEDSYDRTYELKLESGQWRLAGPEWWCPPY